MRRNVPSQLIPVGHQQISLANSTALGLNSTTSAGTVFHLSVLTQDARLRTDGTAPTVNTGVILQADADHWLSEISGSALKFQRDTGTCVIDISAYKHTGQ